jgi:carboxyl-terminal processing protease
MYARRQRSSRWVKVLLGVIVLLVGVWFGGHPSWLPGPVRSVFVAQDSNDKLLNQVLGLIQNDYYRKVSRSDLINKGLQAAVASLDDPYSHYYDQSDYKSFQNVDNPHLSGIGIDIGTKPQPDGLLVQAVFQGSPAAKAGLTRGDVITQVGSTSLANRSEKFSAALIKGKAGTKVTLTVLRHKRKRTVTVTRADIVVPVAASKILDYKGSKLGYVELTSFTAGSGAEVRSQVQQVLHQGARAIILDLRENGGGLVDEAINVASVFIPDGTIVSTDGRAQPRQVYLAKPSLTVAPKIPMVVLVDSGTASAAEIVTGALQDRGRAKVVGTHTYGKGVFQEIEPLPNGGALDFTVGEYFTPSGRNLGGGGVKQGKGIQPNVYASTKSTAKTDTALTVAEKTAAAELGQ